MERLTDIPHIADVYGFYGNSVLNEFRAASGCNWRHFNVTDGKRLQRAAQAAARVANVQELIFLQGGRGGAKKHAPRLHQRWCT
mmetsp:Transcript_21309/g.42672  ORF Transcript_21309/g.42672 Transcript_21309/m.42672 type:complete len:84 (+) Transcript_21309:681-932(+)